MNAPGQIQRQRYAKQALAPRPPAGRLRIANTHILDDQERAFTAGREPAGVAGRASAHNDVTTSGLNRVVTSLSPIAHQTVWQDASPRGPYRLQVAERRPSAGRRRARSRHDAGVRRLRRVALLTESVLSSSEASADQAIVKDAYTQLTGDEVDRRPAGVVEGQRGRPW
jgi:hypothetical protein